MRALRLPALLAAVALGMACANWPRRQHATPAPVAPPEPSRTLPYPVFETKAFARAVERGTRTRTGVPGPNYWQQFARYRIDAELVPTTSQINGRETVRYFNHSPDTLKTVWIFLNQNLFASDVAARTIRARHRRHGDPPRRRRRAGARQARHRRRLLDRRHADARRSAARARAARLGRLRHRVGVPASARRRAARRHDRRRVHGRVLVSADRRVRRRHRLADRPVPRQRRVLHGLRRLRRESERAAGMARRRDRRADESERRAVAADARPTRRIAAKRRRRARGARAGSRRRATHARRAPDSTACSRGASARATCATSTGARRRSFCGTRRSPSSAIAIATVIRTRRRSTRSIVPRRARGRGTRSAEYERSADRVSVELSVVVSVAADDGARGTGVVHGHGVSRC